MLPNKPFTLKTFYSLKTNAVHSMTNCICGILTENQAEEEKVDPFSKKGRPISRKPSTFSYGLQSSPFPYVLTIFLQMLTNDILHKA